MAAGAVSPPLIIPIMHLKTLRPKNHIDTKTPVLLQSDSPGVQIFYTLDGSWPSEALVAARRGSTGSSLKYSEPIHLPAGRVAVRAVAVTRDGRESATVTKLFKVVELVESNRKGNDQQRRSEGTSGSPEISTGSSLKPPEPKTMENTPRFLNGRLGLPGAGAQNGSSYRSQSEQNRRNAARLTAAAVLKQLNDTQASRINRETNFLRCPRCLSFRPSDPFSRFCPHCGAAVPPLPAQRAPPAEGGQAACCRFCNMMVPNNSQKCLICDTEIQQSPKPPTSILLQGHVTCSSCGSGNPANISSCLTCETHLQPAMHAGNGEPCVPSTESRMLSCSRCRRMNRHDARFCDWCGSKPLQTVLSVTCWRCGASGHPSAFYCAACGVCFETQAPPTSCNDITAETEATNQVFHKATPSSDPAPRLMLTTPTTEKTTQTVGLYYPSATELHKKEEQRALQVSRQQGSRNRQPVLTAVSPGRGYWRKQLDHICAHLRSYAQNHIPFRALLGEPRLGRMVSAVIQEDRHEVTLTVSFASTEPPLNQVDPPADREEPSPDSNETLSSVTEGSGDGGRNKRGRSTDLNPTLKPKPPMKDLQLLEELGPGRGQIRIIQQLLDQGADPSCCSSDGRHALAIAVANGHHDVLPMLVQRGADVDQQSGVGKNSALHDAAVLGTSGLPCAQVLLSCKASMRQRNASGQTPYDVAVNSDCSGMASLLAAQTGLELLGKLGKLKVDRDVL